MKIKEAVKKKLRCSLLGLFAAALLLTGSGSGLLNGGSGTADIQKVLAAPAGAASGSQSDEDGGQAEVHFLDVGQGDATLIRCGDHAMLIDAGGNDKGTAVQLYLKKQGIKKLDYLVLTHPDADHIGGADVIITKFAIGKVFMADYTKDNKTYQEVIQALRDKRLSFSTPKPGASYTLGDGEFTILAPVQSYGDANNSSIALLFQFGENRFLFTGDAEQEAEADMLKNGIALNADVYKAAHHGSDTASGEAFLKAVAPKWAVISCGEGNSYGHPHAEVLNRLRAMGVSLFRTDEQGSIIARSDGKQITWNCAPTETWQAGERTGSAARSSQKTGSRQTTQDSQISNAGSETQQGAYIGNKNNGKLHRSSCKKLPAEKNRVFFDTKEEAAEAGYDDACKLCKP